MASVWTLVTPFGVYQIAITGDYLRIKSWLSNPNGSKVIKGLVSYWFGWELLLRPFSLKASSAFYPCIVGYVISEISNPKIVPLIFSPVFIRSFPYFQDGRPPEGLPFPTKSFPKTTSGFSQFKGEVGFWGTQKSHGNGT